MGESNPIDDVIFGFLSKGMAERERLDYGKKKPGRPEKKLEALIGKSLEDQGISVRYQVPCSAGIADIVTPDAIYEVKTDLYSNKLFEAIGQVLIYRQLINPSARVFVAGYAHKGGRFAGQTASIQEAAKALRIELLFWEQDE